MNKSFKVAGPIIKHISIDLTQGNDQHEGESPGLGCEDTVHYKRAKRAPEKSGNCLHADDEFIASCIARISFCVFFPCAHL